MVAKGKAHLMGRCWPREAGGGMNRRGVSNVIGEGGAHLAFPCWSKVEGQVQKKNEASC